MTPDDGGWSPAPSPAAGAAADQIGQTTRVLNIMFDEPVEIIALQQRQIGQFAAQRFRQICPRRQRGQPFRPNPAPLQFPQLQAQLPREAAHPRAAVKNFQLRPPPRQQRAQHHHPALFRKQRRRRLVQFVENKFRQAFKRKNAQPRITRQFRVAQKLAFQLESRLLGREKNQRRPLWILPLRRANFLQAPESFPGAGRTKQKARAHPF